MAALKKLLAWLDLFVVAALWAFGFAMIDTGDFTRAEVLFAVGNLILIGRIVTSSHIDYEYRTVIIFCTLVIFSLISYGEWTWIESKRDIVLAAKRETNPPQIVEVPPSDGSPTVEPPPHGILPPGVVLIPSPQPESARKPKPPKNKPQPQPKSPEPVFNSPDPYVGVSDSLVAQFITQEASSLENLGTDCAIKELAAQNAASKGLPMPSTGGIEGAQGGFWVQYRDKHIEALAKLHDSIVYRLGPVQRISMFNISK